LLFGIVVSLSKPIDPVVFRSVPFHPLAVISSFILEIVAVGTDEDGNVTTAPVVIQAKTTTSDGTRSHTEKALESLERVIEEHGQRVPEDIPSTCRTWVYLSKTNPITLDGQAIFLHMAVLSGVGLILKVINRATEPQVLRECCHHKPR
jgi:hypothetical protein